jgi:hypothetical protein
MRLKFRPVYALPQILGGDAPLRVNARITVIELLATTPRQDFRLLLRDQNGVLEMREAVPSAVQTVQPSFSSAQQPCRR